MVVIGANQKVISIPPTQKYLDLRNICHHMGILRVVTLGNATVFQKAPKWVKVLRIKKKQYEHSSKLN